jgi:hypothetical protein
MVFKQKKYFRLTLFFSQQSLLQFVPNNSVGRQIAVFTCTCLVTAEVYGHSESLQTDCHFTPIMPTWHVTVQVCKHSESLTFALFSNIRN